MTGLAPSKAAQFFRSEDYISAQHTTLTSGIQGLVPSAGGWTGADMLVGTHAAQFCCFRPALSWP